MAYIVVHHMYQSHLWSYWCDKAEKDDTWSFKLYNCTYNCIDQYFYFVAALSRAKRSFNKGNSKKGRLTHVCNKEDREKKLSCHYVSWRLLRQITFPWRKCSEFGRQNFLPIQIYRLESCQSHVPPLGFFSIESYYIS